MSSSNISSYSSALAHIPRYFRSYRYFSSPLLSIYVSSVFGLCTNKIFLAIFWISWDISYRLFHRFEKSRIFCFCSSSFLHYVQKSLCGFINRKKGVAAPVNNHNLASPCSPFVPWTFTFQNTAIILHFSKVASVITAWIFVKSINKLFFKIFSLGTVKCLFCLMSQSHAISFPRTGNFGFSFNQSRVAFCTLPVSFWIFTLIIFSL